MRKSQLGWWLAAIVACGPRPLATGDGGGSGAASDCAPGGLGLTLYGGVVTSSCYQALVSQGGLAFAPTASTSVWGSDGDGLQILFSSSCSYHDGQLLQLTDPCLLISDNSLPGEGALPGSTLPDGGTDCGGPGQDLCAEALLGVTNDCSNDLATSGTVNLGCLGGTTVATSGTLTIDHWSTQSGETISLSVSGNLTGFFAVQLDPTTQPSRQSRALPFSGSASAVVQ